VNVAPCSLPRAGPSPEVFVAGLPGQHLSKSWGRGAGVARRLGTCSLAGGSSGSQRPPHWSPERQGVGAGAVTRSWGAPASYGEAARQGPGDLAPPRHGRARTERQSAGAGSRQCAVSLESHACQVRKWQTAAYGTPLKCQKRGAMRESFVDKLPFEESSRLATFKGNIKGSATPSDLPLGKSPVTAPRHVGRMPCALSPQPQRHVPRAVQGAL